MTTKRFPMILDLLNIGMRYLLLVSFFMMIASGVHIRMQLPEFVGLGIVLIACYMMREHVRVLWIYVLLHALLIGACLLVPMESTGTLRLSITAVVMLLFDLHNWINHDLSVRELHPGLGALFLPVLLFLGRQPDYEYSAAVYYMGIAFAVLVLIRLVVKNFYELSQSGQLDDDMPVKEIFRNNTLVTAVIILFVTGAMLFVRADRLVLALNRIAYFLWEKIAYVLSRTFEGHEELDMPPMEDMGFLLRELATEDADGGFFALIIRLISAAVVLLCIVLILYFACKALILLLQSLFGKREKRTKRYKSFQMKNEIRQSIREESLKEPRSGIFKTPYEKLRELYRKELKRYKKAGVDVRNTGTPEENRAAILTKKGVDLREVTELYEKARYGSENEVDNADVAAMKNSIRSARV